MKFGILSGMTWGLDTVLLVVVLAFIPFSDNAMGAMFGVPVLHDLTCAVLMIALMAGRRRLKNVWAAVKTRQGRVVMLGGLLGGPLAMTGYIIALNNIGAGPAAIVSAFYPAFGTLLAWLLLKEKMSLKQIIALIIALGAITFMSLGYGGAEETNTQTLLIGGAAALLSVVGWGSEAVLLSWGLRNGGIDTDVALTIRESTSALVYVLIIAPITGVFVFIFQAIPTQGYGILFLAALAGVISYLCYYVAIDKLGAPRAMALNVSYAAWAVFFAWLIGDGAGLAPFTYPGTATIVCCIIVIVFTVLAATSDWSQLNFSRSAREAAAAEAEAEAAKR